MFQLIAIAGTFDRLHKGHRYFISEAFGYGRKVLIGLTSDEYIFRKLKIKNEKLKITIQNYKKRKKELEDFLRVEGLIDRTEIVKIDDVYGPTLNNNSIEALVVTKESFNGALEVNRMRILHKMKPLKILQIPLLNAEDYRSISSTRIRFGEIDRYGKVFRQMVQSQTGRVKFTPISTGLRLELKKPQGELIRGDSNNLVKVIPELKSHINKLNPVMIATVGDEVTRICNSAGLMPKLAIFDYKVNRVIKYHTFEELGFSERVGPFQGPTLFKVRNPAGFITTGLVELVAKAMKIICQTGEQQIIEVIGEDDLAGVPAILLSPLGSIVIYGQPGEGIVVVDVTEEKKKKLLQMIR